MDKQSWDKWPAEKVAEWQKFWKSETGKEAINRIMAIKQMQIDNSMTQGDPNLIAAYIGRAAGIEMILFDIQAGIKAAEELKDKEVKGKN